MKRNKGSMLIIGLTIFCFSICMLPLSAHATVVTRDVIIVEVGVYSTNYYQILFEYDGITYTKYIARPADKDIFATALSALSLGGTARCTFDDTTVNYGWITAMWAQ